MDSLGGLDFLGSGFSGISGWSGGKFLVVFEAFLGRGMLCRVCVWGF